MKKICFYVNYLYTIGGIQTVVLTLANELCKDYDVTIIYKNKKKNKDIGFVDSRIKVINLYSNNFFDKMIVFPSKLIHKMLKKYNFEKKYSFYYQMFYERIKWLERKKIINHINKNDYDYILAEGLDLCISFLKIKKHVNSKIIGCWHSSYENYLLKYPKHLVKESILNLDDTIVLSEIDVREIKKNFSLDVKKIYNPSIKSDVNRHIKKENNFLAVGRYASIKQFDQLIKAFAKFNIENKNWKLYIVGDGEEKVKLQKLIDYYNLNEYIYLTGPTNCVNEYYEKSKVLVLTSKAEGFPMVAVEAMQNGLAIISYDIPVLHEMLKAEDIFVENGNVNKLANKMIKYANDSDLINNEGIKYKKLSKQYYIDKIIIQWKEILK